MDEGAEARLNLGGRTREAGRPLFHAKAIAAACALHAGGLAWAIWAPATPLTSVAPGSAVAVILVSAAPASSSRAGSTRSPFQDLRSSWVEDGAQPRRATPGSLDNLLGERGAEPDTQTPSGPALGGDADPLGRLFLSQEDNSPSGLRNQVMRCWKHAPLPRPVRVQFMVETTGRLLRPPTPLREPFVVGPLQGEAEAIKAVERCGPYRGAGGRSYIMEFR